MSLQNLPPTRAVRDLAAGLRAVTSDRVTVQDANFAGLFEQVSTVLSWLQTLVPIIDNIGVAPGDAAAWGTLSTEISTAAFLAPSAVPLP